MNHVAVSLLLVFVAFSPLLRHVAAEEFEFERASLRAWHQNKSNSRREREELLLENDTAAEEKGDALSESERRKLILFDSRSRSKKTPVEGLTLRHKETNRIIPRHKQGHKDKVKNSRSRSARGKKKSTKGKAKKSKSRRGKKGVAKSSSRSKVPRPSPKPPKEPDLSKDIDSSESDDIIIDPESCDRRADQKCCRDICDSPYMMNYCNNKKDCKFNECRKGNNNSKYGFLTTCSGCPEFRCHCEQPDSHEEDCEAKKSDGKSKCSSGNKIRCCLAQCFGIPPFLEVDGNTVKPETLGESESVDEYCGLLGCDTDNCPVCSTYE